MATQARYAPCDDCGQDDHPHVHLDDIVELRVFLDSPARIDGMPLALATGLVPDFDNAHQADDWLWAHDLEDEIERAHEWDLEHHGRGGRI